MKKVLYLCLMVAVMPFMSCSSDDDKKDPIIGKWQYTAEVEYVNGEQQPIEELSDCEKKSWIEFRVDGSGSSNFYDTNGVGECVGDDPVLTFIWASKGNNIYGVSANDDGEQNIKITFEGNIMKISETHKDGETEHSYTDTYTKSN